MFGSIIEQFDTRTERRFASGLIGIVQTILGVLKHDDFQVDFDVFVSASNHFVTIIPFFTTTKRFVS